MNGWDWFRAVVCFFGVGVVFYLVFDIHPAYVFAVVVSITIIAAWVGRIQESDRAKKRE